MSPPVSRRDSSSSSSTEAANHVDLNPDIEWHDVSEDEESVEIVSLFDDRTFPNVQGMLAHCKNERGFDFEEVVRRFGRYVSPRQILLLPLFIGTGKD